MKNARPVRRRALLILAPALLGAGLSSAEEKNDFREHAFFKHLIGEWKSSGELKNAEGQPVKIAQEWKAEPAGANTLVIEGRREVNGNAENYKWTFTRSPSTGVIEAELRPNTANPDTLRFELNVPDTGLKIEMTALLGTGQSKVVLEEQFAEKDRDTFETKITLTDEKGTVTLSGSLKNERTKK